MALLRYAIIPACLVALFIVSAQEAAGETSANQACDSKDAAKKPKSCPAKAAPDSNPLLDLFAAQNGAAPKSAAAPAVAGGDVLRGLMESQKQAEAQRAAQQAQEAEFARQQKQLDDQLAAAQKAAMDAAREAQEAEDAQEEAEERARRREASDERDAQTATAILGMLGSMQNQSQRQAVTPQIRTNTVQLQALSQQRQQQLQEAQARVAAARAALQEQQQQARAALQAQTQAAQAAQLAAQATAQQDAPAKGCLSNDNSRTSLGGISTDSTVLVNRCGFKVTYGYCVTSSNGGGLSACRSGNRIGTNGVVAPYGTDGISIMGASSPFVIHIAECKSPAGPHWTYGESDYHCGI